MLAAITAPAHAVGPNVSGLLSQVAGLGIGAVVAALCTYFVIRRADRKHIVDDERMAAYMKLSEYFSQLRTAVAPDKWPSVWGDVGNVMQKIREHCASKLILLDPIALDIVDFYDTKFQPWYREATEKKPAGETVPALFPLFTRLAFDEFWERILDAMIEVFPIQADRLHKLKDWYKKPFPPST